MGSELVSNLIPYDDRVEQSTLNLYTNAFRNHLPMYLAMGMTVTEYYDEDCLLAKYYREAFEIKKRQKNFELWLQGMYVYEALCDVSPILRAFSKADKPNDYSKEPYPLTKAEIEEREKTKQEIEMNKMKAKMAAWAAKVNVEKAKGG